MFKSPDSTTQVLSDADSVMVIKKWFENLNQIYDHVSNLGFSEIFVNKLSTKQNALTTLVMLGLLSKNQDMSLNINTLGVDTSAQDLSSLIILCSNTSKIISSVDNAFEIIKDGYPETDFKELLSELWKSLLNISNILTGPEFSIINKIIKSFPELDFSQLREIINKGYLYHHYEVLINQDGDIKSTLPI